MRKFFKIDSEGKIKNFKIKKKEEKRDNNFFYFKYFNLGFYLITPLLICLFIGIYFKKVIFFIFLGIVFTFYNLIKLTKE